MIPPNLPVAEHTLYTLCANNIDMIQFNNVKKEYKHNEFVLGELNFGIDEGEFVFLIGPSGSGKTSIIKLLIREENPTYGKIFFDDYDITRITRSSIYKLRRYVGVIFQDYKLIADKTVAENVAFAMEVAGKSTKEIKDTVPYLLDIVGLSHRANAFPSYLSGGEKQRVAIARAVSNNPRVLIADEPTGNLDPAAAWDIVQILSKINNWGTTVIMSTHGTDIVNTLNKRVIQMENGLIVRDDSRGAYEQSQRPKAEEGDANPLQELAALDDERSGPIKVRIKATATGDSNEQKKRGAFSWLWPFSSRNQNEPEMTELEEEFGTEVDRDMAKEEFVKDVDDALEQVTEEEVEKVLADADNTPVEKLDLRPEIIADLKTAGYNDVEDIIVAGPDALTSELIIDPEEVVLVARALTEFINEEDEKWRQEELLNSEEQSEPESDAKKPRQRALNQKSKGKPKDKTKETKSPEPEEKTETKPKSSAKLEPKKKKSSPRVDLTHKSKSK